MTDRLQGALATVQSPLHIEDLTHEGEGRSLKPHTLLITARLRLYTLLVHVTDCIVPPSALSSSSVPLFAALDASFGTLDTHLRAVLRRREQEFFDSVMRAHAEDPLDVFDVLCSAWQKLTASQWTWLWVYNELTETFELTATASAAGISDPTVLPNLAHRPGQNSAAALATHSNSVVIVEDVATWSQTFNGTTYRIALPDCIKQMGSNSFICVPLICGTSPEAASPSVPTVKGAVCLHFETPNDFPRIAADNLLRLGRAAAHVLMESFMIKHSAMLDQLNRMAQKYLTRLSRFPEKDRNAYLNDLIALITSQLHFRSVSIFQRRPFSQAISCVASTGLIERRTSAVLRTPVELTSAEYGSGEGRTGECFANGQPRVFNKENLDSRTDVAKYYELDPVDGSFGQPFVLYPILSDDKRQSVLGVIRCVNHQKPKRGPIQDRPLTLELQPLEFISQQVAPVLQTLETRIIRERAISTIKHDLISPSNMIRDTTNRILEHIDGGRSVREYDIKDLGAASALIRNLVWQLDPDPSEPVALSPKPTFLMGDILARVVNMLRHYAYEEKHMQIQYVDIEKIPKLNVDRALIERAIHNLVVNAIKYGNEGSTIWIRGRESRAGYCLDVENEGIGIEQDEERFIGIAGYRSQGAQKVAMGVGLGLAITRSAIESHGGKMFVTQRKGPTIMTLYFPRGLALDGRR